MPFRPISLVLMLVAVFLLVTGNGILSALIPFRAKLEGFPDLLIGFIGSSFYAGLLGGAVVTPALVRQVGHLKTFAICGLAGAVGGLASAFIVEPYLWMVFRLAIGCSLTGLYSVVESWLSQASESRQRGWILGICSVVQYGAWSAGSQIFTLADPGQWTLFAVAGVCLLASIPFLLLVRTKPPERPHKSVVNLIWFYRVAPAAAVAGLLTGMANGPLFSLTPVFGDEIGLSQRDVGTMLTAFMLGSALFQIPNGWLSDRLNRQHLLAALALISTVSEVTLGRCAGVVPVALTYSIALVVGASDAAQYYVAAAAAIDRGGREQAVMVMSSLIVLYGMGAIVGPPLASATMTLAGPAALYLYQGGIHAVLVLFVLWRILAEPRKPQTLKVKVTST